MKKYLFSISFFLLGISLFAQAPQGINFQAVARKSDGNPMSNETIIVTFKIRHGSPSASPLFEETHNNIQTDDCGMFRLTIGSIDPNNSFENIEWSTGFKWLEVLVNDFSIGNQEMLSVPYALYAETSGNGGTTYTAGQGISIAGGVISNTGDSDNSPNNEIQVLTLSGNQLILSNGGGTVMLSGTDAQTLSLTGNQLSISNGNMVSLPQDGDGNSTNEIQTISLSGSQLTLSNGGGAVNLPPDADAQTLSLSGDQLMISGGNSVTIPNNTYQAGSGISINGSVITNTALSPVIEVNSANMNTVVAPDGSVVAINGTISLSGTYQKLENSAVIMGGVINGNGNKMYFENYATISGTVFNNVNVDGLSVSFHGCTFNSVSELPSKASFTGCYFNTCNVTAANNIGFMENCTIAGCMVSRLDKISNSLVSNSTLGTTTNYVTNVSNCEFNDSYVYVNGTFTGNDCDNSQVLARTGGHVTITGNNWEVSSSGLSTDLLNVDLNTGSRHAVNISNNNFLGATSNPSGQYIRLYGSYTGTRCIVRISNNIFIGGSAKAISYECMGQVDCMVNDNDLRSVSGGLGVSNGGFVTIRNNVTH